MPPTIKSIIHLFLTTFIALALTAPVGIEGQIKDPLNWHTVGSESDEANSVIYQALSDFDGKHYETTVYGHDLEGIQKWKEGQEPPVSILKAKTIAQNALQKRFPQFGQFKLMSVNFMHLTIVDDWIIQVEFDGTNWATVQPGAFEDRKIDILVLLDGRAITPTDTAK